MGKTFGSHRLCLDLESDTKEEEKPRKKPVLQLMPESENQSNQSTGL